MIQPRSRTHKISLSFLIWNVFDSSLHLPPYSLCDLFCQWVACAVCACRGLLLHNKQDVQALCTGIAWGSDIKQKDGGKHQQHSGARSFVN